MSDGQHRLMKIRATGPAFPVFLLILLLGIGCGEASERKANTSSIVVENGVPKLAVNGRAINNMFAVEVFSSDVNAEQPRFLADMKKVIDNTAALNIPVLSFEVLWHDYDHSTSAPRSAEEAADRFNTTNLDAVLDYAAERRVYVMLELLKHQHWALPKWWKSYKSNSTGSQMLGPPSAAVDQYNRSQTPVASFGNPDHRELLEGLIRKLISRYRDHPAVIGYGINMGPTGENGYIPNYIDLMFNPSMPRLDIRSVMADYSPLAVKNFISFLKKKYPSIADLNRKWNTRYAAFEEITPPYPKQASAHETFAVNGDDRPSMLDWQHFRLEAIVDEWRFLSGLVRRLDPDKVIMGKTNWSPMAAWTGTEFMNVSSARVNSEKFIDIDKMDASLFMRDYMPEFEHTSSYSKLDYVHFSRFSKKYGRIRVFNLDNSVKRLHPGVMDISIALPAKEVLKKEGCYLWFPVLLESDKFPKPDWSWDEIAALVKKSGAEELKGVSVEEPGVKFYFDPDNVISHYYDALPGLKASGLAFALSKAIYDGDNQPVGFIEAADVSLAPPDPAKTRMLVLTNQRVIPPAVAANLKAYTDRGGVLLLLGSNGVFDGNGQKDGSAFRGIVPSITDGRLGGLYEWGLSAPIKVPFFVVSKGKTKYAEIDISKDPSENYRLLAGAVPDSVALPKTGRLIFVSISGRPTLKDTGEVSGLPGVAGRPPMQAPYPGAQNAPPPGPGGPGQPGPHAPQGPPPQIGGVSSPPQYPGGPPPSPPPGDPGQPRYYPDRPPPQQYGGGPGQPAPYPGGAPVPQKRNFIKDWDRNGDGVVTRDEFTGDAGAFDRMDLNRDGRITPDEAERAGE